MEIITVGTMQASVDAAVKDIANQLKDKKADSKPAFLLIYFHDSADPEILRKTFKSAFPNTVFTGIATESGAFDKNYILGMQELSGINVAPSLAPKRNFSVNRFKVPNTPVDTGMLVMAFYGNDVSFGNDVGAYSEANPLKPAEYFRQSSDMAGLPGAMPDLILLHCSLGANESFEKHCREYYGDSVPVVGGVFPLQHDAKAFTAEESYIGSRIYIVTLMYLSCNISVESHNCCEPVGPHGIVTMADGYTIIEIDNQPAADVFYLWIGINSTEFDVARLNEERARYWQNCIIGHPIADIYGNCRYNLTVTMEMQSDHSIVTRHKWHTGERICLMSANNNYLKNNFVLSERIRGKVLGSLHMMCISHCSGVNKVPFQNNIVNPVREMDTFPFITAAVDGEFGKDLNTVNLLVGSYNVSSVWFWEKDIGKGI